MNRTEKFGLFVKNYHFRLASIGLISSISEKNIKRVQKFFHRVLIECSENYLSVLLLILIEVDYWKKI